MSHSDFTKFPHTPHLIWLGQGKPRDDKVLSKRDVDEFLNGDIVVEEKVDGTNLGLSLASDGALQVQTRGAQIKPGSHPQYDALWPWLCSHGADLREVLSRGLMLFGEWCFAKHSIPYDKLPDWFLLFDVYDRREKRFWSILDRNSLAEKTRLKTVPFISQGGLAAGQLPALLRDSVLYGGPMEGIYLRREMTGHLLARAKIVNPLFISQLQEHWSGNQFVRNKLAEWECSSASIPLKVAEDAAHYGEA